MDNYLPVTISKSGVSVQLKIKKSEICSSSLNPCRNMYYKLQCETVFFFFILCPYISIIMSSIFEGAVSSSGIDGDLTPKSNPSTQ